MNTKQLLQEMITDSARGDYYALLGIIDYLLTDRNYSKERLARFALRSLNIPWETTFSTLEQLGFHNQTAIH